MGILTWNSLLAVLVYLGYTIDAQLIQDSISMTSDGWRPIIGSSRRPQTAPAIQEEIQYYRNPIQSETVKAETPSTTPAPPPSPPPSPTSVVIATAATTPKKHQQPFQDPNKPLGFNHNQLHNGVKIIPHHMKNQYFVVPNGAHPPHIPLNNVGLHGRPPPTLMNHFKKYSMISKPHNHGIINGKRVVKPMRIPQQVGAHNTRDEVYIPAPPGVGFSPFYSKKQNIVKTRQTADLGIHGAKPFHSQQPHGPPVNFPSHFQIGPPGQAIFQPFNGPIQGYVNLKLPQTNEVHYQLQKQEEYSKNLVPPPTFQPPQTVNPNNQNRITNNHVVTEPVRTQQFGNQKPVIESVFAPVKQTFQQQKVNQPQVQITKEQIKVFHNEVPPQFSQPISQFVDYDFHTVRQPDVSKPQTYEVTEPDFHPGNQFVHHFPEQQFFVNSPRPVQKSRQPLNIKPHITSNVELNLPPFLPTPYKPEGIVPTSPTQREVSTVYSQISNMNIIKEKRPSPSTTSYYDIKEVSTHYPILGTPVFEEDLTTVTPEKEIENEITINKYGNHQMEDYNQHTTPKPSVRKPTRSRLPYRRRKPIITTTTTEEPYTTEMEMMQETVTEGVFETESPSPQPTRRRKPLRHRTSTTPYPEEDDEELSTERPLKPRQKYRYRPSYSEDRNPPRKRIKPGRYKTTKLPPNHKITEYKEEESTEQGMPSFIRESYSEAADVAEISREEYTKRPRLRYETPDRYRTENLNARDSYETTAREEYNSIHPQNIDETVDVTEIVRIMTSTEPPHTTIVENKDDSEYTTKNINGHAFTEHQQQKQEAEDEEMMGYVTQLTTSTTTTTTSTQPSTPKPLRTRRPIKYDSSNRPRFSVKEYRQRLNQYSSTTTAEPNKSTSETTRLRYPNRGRRPATSTYTSVYQGEESTTDRSRSRFRPKEPRHSGPTESTNLIITEKNIKPVNTNLRPFGRHRTTTENPSTSTRVSIRPNLFARRTRPPLLNLKSRINNKNNVTEINEVQTGQDTVTEQSIEADPETVKEEVQEDSTEPEEVETTTSDILRNDHFSQIQRISELTSSAKKEYDTPGVFKSVAPTSRRILPNYFTISTDDPILPIEAFFTNLKEKE